MYRVIEECFSTDEDLLNKWHIKSGSGLDQCTQDTCNVLKYETKSLIFYTINNGKEIVGYFGNENREALTSFFVKPQYRNKESMKDIWKLITNTFPKEFKCGVYCKNIPANTFLTKNNAVLLQTGEHDGNEYNFYKIEVV